MVETQSGHENFFLKSCSGSKRGGRCKIACRHFSVYIIYWIVLKLCQMRGSSNYFPKSCSGSNRGVKCKIAYNHFPCMVYPVGVGRPKHLQNIINKPKPFQIKPCDEQHFTTFLSGLYCKMNKIKCGAQVTVKAHGPLVYDM